MHSILNNQLIGFESGVGTTSIVLLHAFPLSPEMWIDQIGHLSRLTRVIAPAAPGFDDRDTPAHPWTMDTYADQLETAFANASIDEVILCGLSMGGYVALSFARKYPRRLRGLILADTKADADDATAKANRDRLMALTREQGTASLIELLLPKLLAEQTLHQQPAIANRIRQLASRQSRDAVVVALQSLRDRPDSNPVLASIRVPTLILVGAKDELTPPSVARRMADQIPNSRVIEIPDAGHLPNVEQPQMFNSLVEAFIQEITAGR